MSSKPQLLAVIEVAQAHSVMCQMQGCGKAVYKRVHIVRIGSTLAIFGSECFKRLFGHDLSISTVPVYGPTDGRVLTQEQIALLLENTEKLIALFEEGHQAQIKAHQERMAAQQRRRESIRSSTMAFPKAPNLTGRPSSGSSFGQRPAASADPLEALSQEESEELRQEALSALKADYPGIDLATAGWQGLVRGKMRDILKERQPQSQLPQR